MPEIPQEQGSSIGGAYEAAKSVGGAVGGQILSGIEGAARSPFQGVDKAVEEMRKTQDYFSSQPKTVEGEKALELVTRSLAGLEEAKNYIVGGTAGLAKLALNPSQGIEGAQKTVDTIRQKGVGPALGQDVMNRTGNAYLATGAELIPAITEIAGGKIAGRGLDGNIGRTASKPTLQEDVLLASGKSADVPLLTTDVFPPNSYVGKFTQRLSEKLGPLGSGTARRSQQLARQDAVTTLANEFNVQLDSPFFDEIISSISTKSAKILEKGNAQRRSAIDSLSQYGEVPTTSTSRVVSDLIARQESLGDVANTSLIKKLQDYDSAIKGKNFNDVAAVRTELIGEIKDLERSDSIGAGRTAIALSKAKQAIDTDMMDFARASDRASAGEWLNSTRLLSDQLTKVKQTELKRLIEKGEAKPEMVSTILKGGKRSELERLRTSLSDDGLASARAAIIRDSLDKSGFFKDAANPDSFATQLGKTNTKQAIDVLFSPMQKAKLEGFERLLNATRRAQGSSQIFETGSQNVLLASSGAIGYGLNSATMATIAGVGTASAIAKAYESKAFTSLLLKIKRTRKGSAEEKKILENALPAVLAGLQAAKEEQQIDIVSKR
jgi:hypothetical protein